MNQRKNLRYLIEEMVSDIVTNEKSNQKVLGFFTEQIESIVINKVLEITNNNNTKASTILGISRSTLNNKLKKLKSSD